MQIPNNTVSPSQLRTYGSSDVRTDEQEADRGCPRRWKAKYVDGVKDDDDSYPLKYGSLFHRVADLVGTGLDPAAAIAKAVDRETTVEMIDELIKDVETYYARPQTPTDELALLGSEKQLKMLLYVDEDFGPVFIRAILDFIGVHPSEPNVIHVVDYKTNRAPISASDLAGDIQMRAQALLAKRWAASEESGLKFSMPPRVIAHLDLIKFRDYPYEFSDVELESFETWAIALCRTILRDEEALPVLNSHCPSCPVKDTCPALLASPEGAKQMAANLARTGEDLEAGLHWRTEANAMRLMLEKVVKAWDAELKTRLTIKGPLVIGGKLWQVVPSETSKPDVLRIAELLGADFPKYATVTKTAIENSSLDESTKARVLAQFAPMFTGTKVISTNEKAGDKTP